MFIKSLLAMESYVQQAALQMTKTEIYKAKFTEDSWPGLEAINVRKQELYGDIEPIHWATIVPYELGGEDPLWAVECFQSDKQQAHFHYLTLGFTNLWYDTTFAEDEVNGFGFELTFRHLPVKDDPASHGHQLPVGG